MTIAIRNSSHTKTHMRDDGTIVEGDYCRWCGQPCGILISHIDCAGNAKLVAKIADINRYSSFEEYTFSLLKRNNNGTS